MHNQISLDISDYLRESEYTGTHFQLDADQILPIYMYLILNAQIKELYATIAYLTNFYLNYSKNSEDCIYY